MEWLSTKATNQLYISETGTHRIWKGAPDSASFSWNNPEVYTNIGSPVGPDGTAFDKRGQLLSYKNDLKGIM